MALDSLDQLDRFAASGFPPGWDDLDWGRAFHGPHDDVPGAVAALLRSAEYSVFAAYGKDLEGTFLEPPCFVSATSCYADGSMLAVIDSTDVIWLGPQPSLLVLRDPTMAAYHQAYIIRLQRESA